MFKPLRINWGHKGAYWLLIFFFKPFFLQIVQTVCLFSLSYYIIKNLNSLQQQLLFYLPDFVIIISVPSSWNFFHSSLVSSTHSTSFSEAWQGSKDGGSCFDELTVVCWFCAFCAPPTLSLFSLEALLVFAWGDVVFVESVSIYLMMKFTVVDQYKKNYNLLTFC